MYKETKMTEVKGVGFTDLHGNVHHINVSKLSSFTFDPEGKAMSIHMEGNIGSLFCVMDQECFDSFCDGLYSRKK